MQVYCTVHNLLKSLYLKICSEHKTGFDTTKRLQESEDTHCEKKLFVNDRFCTYMVKVGWCFRWAETRNF